MTITHSPEAERLQALDVELERWKARILDGVEKVRDAPVDEAFGERFAETQKRLLELNEQLHAEDFDPEALAELRDIMLRWIAAANDFDAARPLDSVDSYLVHAEAMRHLVRDALDNHVEGADRDAQTVVAQLLEWLPHTTQAEIARLVGISDRQFHRWKTSGGQPPRRLSLVARLVALLRRAWTEQGVVAWFHRPRRELDGKTPFEVLDDPAYERLLLTAVRQGRAEHGS
jgi:uncharacterized protein (DUF2384 family)